MAFSFPTGVKRRTDCLSMILGEDVAEQHMLAWRQELGELDPNNPLVTPAMPWDSGSVFAHGTFAHDPIDGLWKAWHVSTPLTAGVLRELPARDLSDFGRRRRVDTSRA